jgi:hypothetical protein
MQMTVTYEKRIMNNYSINGDWVLGVHYATRTVEIDLLSDYFRDMAAYVKI